MLWTSGYVAGAMGVARAECVLIGSTPSVGGGGQSLLGLCSAALSSPLSLLFPNCWGRGRHGFY